LGGFISHAKRKVKAAIAVFTGGDQYFSNVSLLLKGDGTNGSTSIIDNSPIPKTVTAYGNAQISTAQSKFGGSSLYFDGSGDYLRIPYDASICQLAVGDFTVEYWLNYSNLTNSVNGFSPVLVHGDVSSGYDYFSFGPLANGTVKLYYYTIGTVNTTTTVSPNVWNHLAFVRTGNTLVVYINGVNSGSTTVNSNAPPIDTSYPFAIGMNGNGNVTGYIDDFRITKGVARYTANFTPPDSLPAYASASGSISAIGTEVASVIDFRGSGKSGSGIWLDQTGTKMITVGYGDTNLTAFTLSTPFMISSASSWYSATISGSTSICWFSKNGLVGLTGDRGIVTSSILTTPFDMRNVSSTTTLTGLTDAQGAGFNIDGTVFWYYRRSNDAMYHYDLSTPYNLSTATLNNAKSKTGWQASITSGANSYGIRISDDGLTCTLNGYTANGTFNVWKMTAPYDFSTLASQNAVQYSGRTFTTYTAVTAHMGLFMTDKYIYLFDNYPTSNLRQLNYTP